MKKQRIYTILLLTTLVGFTNFSYGQNYKKKLNKQQRIEQNATYFGIKGGISQANIFYTGDPNLEMLNNESVMRPVYGLFIERIKGNIGFGAELLSTGGGTHIEYPYMEQFSVVYDVSSDYLNLRIPLSYSFLSGSNISPYLYLAPSVAYNYSGSITRIQNKNNGTPDNTSDDTYFSGGTIDMGKANMAQFQASLLAGAGVRFRIQLPSYHFIVKMNAAYNYGLTNTYSKAEMEETISSENVNAFNINGKRFNRGFEYTLSIGIPLKKADRGACMNWGAY